MTAIPPPGTPPEQIRLAQPYLALDDNLRAQQLYDSRSLIGETFARMGVWGLHHASDHAAVRTFLNDGAPINGVKLIAEYEDDLQHFEVPLLTSLVDERLEAVKALITAGADVDAPNMVRYPSGQGFGLTSLHSMASRLHAEGVELLIAAGADVNRQTTIGWTPLHFAAQKDDVSMVTFLRDSGARTDIVDIENAKPATFAGPRTIGLLS